MLPKQPEIESWSMKTALNFFSSCILQISKLFKGSFNFLPVSVREAKLVDVINQLNQSLGMQVFTIKHAANFALQLI